MNIQPPGPTNGNVVQVVTNDWLYVTSSDGTISKINPRNGEYKNIYKPEVISDDWIMYGGKGLSFFHSKQEGGGDDDESGGGRFDINNTNENESSDGYSYLLYWVIDVPKTSDSNNVASSRIIAIKHDDEGEEELNVLWTKSFVGTISGTPVIG